MSFCSLVYLGRQAVWPRKPVAATSGCAGMPAVQRSIGQRWKDMTEAAEGLLQAPMKRRTGKTRRNILGSAAAPCLGAAKGQFHGNIAGAQHLQETDYVAMADNTQNDKTSV